MEIYGFEAQFATPDRWNIIGIDEQSWAYRNGLRLGDIWFGNTLKIDGKTVTHADTEYLRSKPHAVVEFDYERDGVTHHLAAPYSDPMRDQLFQD